MYEEEKLFLQQKNHVSIHGLKQFKIYFFNVSDNNLVISLCRNIMYLSVLKRLNSQRKITYIFGLQI